MANAIIYEETGVAMEYRKLITSPKLRPVWIKYFVNVILRIAQGVNDRVEGTGTMIFILHDNITENRRKYVTYGRIVVDYHPQKDDPHHTRITVGRNLIKHPEEVSTITTDLTTSKLLFNTTTSTSEARFMCCDIKNIYLGNPWNGIDIFAFNST